MRNNLTRRQFIKLLAVGLGATGITIKSLRQRSLAQTINHNIFLPWVSENGNQDPSPTVTSPAVTGSPTATSPTVTTSPTATSPTVTPQPGIFNDIVFLHHSVGYLLLIDGDVRESLTVMGYNFWDHADNSRGLFMPDGTAAGYNYNIPNDDTSPGGYDLIFQQILYTSPMHPTPPENAFSGLMRHSVICFKSCFTEAGIDSDEKLAQYKSHYLNIRNRIDEYPDHIFIPFSIPPRHPCATNPSDAARVRAFANWMKSAEYLDGHPNIFTFDFFDLLAEPDPYSPDYNMLRESYRKPTEPNCDSHPKKIASVTIGPIFSTFVDDSIRAYSGK